MEDVVHKNEKQGGERATLLDPSPDINEEAGGEGGGDPDCSEQVLHRVDEPRREPLLIKGCKNEVVVNAIERLRVVREKDEKLGILAYHVVEGFV